MIPTLSGSIGLVEGLDALGEQFAGSEVHQQKLRELSSEFGAYRRCRGDGNCYYRAFGFAVVEGLLRRRPASLKPVLDRVEADAADEATGFLGLARTLCDLEPQAALRRWYDAILTDPELDQQLVRAIRRLSAEYLTRNASVDFNGLPLNVYVEASHGMSLNAFRDSELLANAVEAESVSLTLAPKALGLKIEIVQLDRSDAAAQRYTVPDSGEEEPLATLLFKPGHYDILYRNSPSQELLGYQQAWDLAKTCCKKPVCAICWDETEDLAQRCGCSICADCFDGWKEASKETCSVCKMSLGIQLAEC